MSPYFHYCVRDRNILVDTIGRHSRQAKVLIGTSISPYFHFCVCVAGLFLEILLEGVADRLRFQLEHKCLRTFTIVCVTGLSLEILLEGIADKLRS